MRDFASWKELFEQEDLFAFNQNPEGLLWLKLKSVMRPDLIRQLQIKIPSLPRRASEVFAACYRYFSLDIGKGTRFLDAFIREAAAEQLKALNEKKLTAELYKFQTFDWGGDYRNSLDKYLVRNYVKAIDSYDGVLQKLDTEIPVAVRGYVLNSWYNHWTSILIENLFKRHPAVLPTVGKMKSVDFFIRKVPFDLKVTYLPREWARMLEKEIGLPSEVAFLKETAKQLGIPYTASSDPSIEILGQLRDWHSVLAKQKLTALQVMRKRIIDATLSAPRRLIQWLYENQGEMRFGAENRLFVVLIDVENPANAWQLKRNLPLLKPCLYRYLNRFSKVDLKKLRLDFTYPGKAGRFSVWSDVIFVVKEQEK